MIRTIDIRLNAAHPELPLPEATTYQNAPSTAFLRGVPKSCGLWQITAVSVVATFPDNSTTTRAAVLSAGDVWVCTIPACATSGRTTSGLRILADGIDENGDAVTGYVLGVADLAVATFDIAPAPGETSYALRYFDNIPNPPHKGDVTQVDGALKYYNGTAWQPFADVPSPSTAAPLTDGTASAGTSADYARGDHRHPTDTTRASKADATLAERTGQGDDWQFGPLTTTDTYYVWAYTTPEYSNGVWTTEITNGPDFATLTANGGADATYLEFATASGATPTASGVVWRSANGYQLGSQTDKPLASEAEAEALRQGKQDVLTEQQLANIAAVPGKLDATSAAPAFSDSASRIYAVGDHCTYNGKLYTCIVQTTGGTWNASCWGTTKLVKPPLLITPGNLVALGAGDDGTTLADSGIAMSNVAVKGDLPYSQTATTGGSSLALSTRSGNRYDFSAVTGEVAVTLPTVESGKCADVVCTIVTGATVPTLSFPSGAVFIAADSAWQTLAASSYNVFSFTSTGAANEWIVGRITSALPTA